MFLRLFGIFALMVTVSACQAQTPPAADAFQQGRDYQLIQPPQPTSSDTIEVIEVFGYSCIHCANAEPVIHQWNKTLPEDVSFQQMPAVFGGVWEAYARAYYTAETMGILPKTHDPLFRAIHVERKPFRNLEDIAKFHAETAGIDQEQFLATMNSFAVNAKIARAQQQVPRFGVEGTPTMVVAGKYRVSAPAQGSHEKMLDIVDYLVEKERAERAAG